MKTAVALCSILLLAGAANAQGKPKACLQMVPRATIARPGVASLDQLSLCHQERARIETSIQGLRNQIAAAKTQLTLMVGLSFRCTDQQTSANNRGQVEDCTPNACLAATGRCVSEIHSTDDCAAGYLWDSSTGNCVRP